MLDKARIASQLLDKGETALAKEVLALSMKNARPRPPGDNFRVSIRCVAPDPHWKPKDVAEQLSNFLKSRGYTSVSVNAEGDQFSYLVEGEHLIARQAFSWQQVKEKVKEIAHEIAEAKREENERLAPPPELMSRLNDLLNNVNDVLKTSARKAPESIRAIAQEIDDLLHQWKEHERTKHTYNVSQPEWDSITKHQDELKAEAKKFHDEWTQRLESNPKLKDSLPHWHSWDEDEWV